MTHALALQQLEHWALAQKESTVYEIRATPGAALLDSLPPPGPSKATVLAAALGGMALVIGAGAFYVVSLKREASEKIHDTAASAAAAVEAENERKLREAEKYVFGDPDDLRYSLALMHVVLGPLAVLVFWSGLRAYGAAYTRARTFQS